MAAPTCSKCGGTRWVRYFSETLDGGFEDAFRLCSCCYAPEGQGERARERSERVEIALECRLPLASQTVTLRIGVELDAAIFR
jgi:hypothetical protein